jgi:hypothetical protein
VLVPRLQVSAKQFGDLVHPRSGDVGHQAGGLAKRKLDEPVGHLARVDGLARNPVGAGIAGSRAIHRITVRIRS